VSPHRPGGRIEWSALPHAVEMVSSHPFHARLTVPHKIESVRPAAAFFVETAKGLNVAAASTPAFEVAIAEALTNAVKHGGAATTGAVIVCEIEHTARQLVVRVIDTGPGFAVVPAPLPQIKPEEVESLPESGYGLPIIHQVFPSVRGIRKDGRFALELSLPLP
jgi:serine/threonine-protein kinase RsbW